MKTFLFEQSCDCGGECLCDEEDDEDCEDCDCGLDDDEEDDDDCDGCND